MRKAPEASKLFQQPEQIQFDQGSSLHLPDVGGLLLLLLLLLLEIAAAGEKQLTAPLLMLAELQDNQQH